jgi:hypothetical protein
MKTINDILEKLAESSNAGKVLLNLHTMPSFETDSHDCLHHRSRGNGNGGNCVDCGTPTFGYGKDRELNYCIGHTREYDIDYARLEIEGDIDTINEPSKCLHCGIPL